MTRAIRFHLDEHVNPAIANVLRRRGIDITTTTEAGLCRADDQSQIAYAWHEGRVLVTHDDDFLRWHSRGVPHAGIAYCRQEARSLGQIIEMLILMHDTLTPKEMIGQVQFL